jgi:type II secretory pathway predicted ATPase ExeA
METSSEKLLQIVLSGQPELEERLRNPIVRQLRQRISLWCKTEPLTYEETQAYIAERLRIAGATEPAFSSEAIDLIHRFSCGIPRLINLICDQSMIAAFADQIKPVPPQIVASVVTELALDEQLSPISP